MYPLGKHNWCFKTGIDSWQRLRWKVHQHIGNSHRLSESPGLGTLIAVDIIIFHPLEPLYRTDVIIPISQMKKQRLKDIVICPRSNSWDLTGPYPASAHWYWTCLHCSPLHPASAECVRLHVVREQIFAELLLCVRRSASHAVKPHTGIAAINTIYSMNKSIYRHTAATRKG